MRSRSAALELTLLASAVMAVLLLTFTWIYLRRQRAWVLDEVGRGLSLTSDTLQHSLRSSMMHGARDEILETIEDISRDTGISGVRVIRHDGTITLSTWKEDTGRVLEPDAPGCSACHEEEEDAEGTWTVQEGSSMRAFTPVLAQPGCATQECHQEDKASGVLGVIDLSLSLDEVEMALTRHRIELGLITLGAILLGGGGIWLGLSRRFHRPMRDLLRGIRRVSRGELSRRIPVRALDEFGEVAESFNEMSGQLDTLRRALIRSERLISMGKLAAAVAHEINNPLTGILAYAEDLVEDLDPSDPHRKDCEVIVHEALRCRQIVRNLLEFARQSAPSFRRVAPGDIITRALETVARQAAFRNIRFQERIQEDLPPVFADPTQIQQVLVNLIINAQQAMPEGGTITLGARRVDGGRKVEFFQTDEGSGIPPEIRERIFEPFFSTKGGTSDGLGLAVCMGIIQQHRGRIHLESEPGKGATFRVVLPVPGEEETRG